MKHRLILIGSLLLILLFVGLIFLTYERRHEPIELRAAMDIGSGATNLKIATVNPKTGKIINHIFEKSIPVAYQKHLEQSSDNTFDPEVMDQGIQAIQHLKSITDKYQVQKVVAVATAAFRKAENAPAFVQSIEEKTGVKVYIINQDEEGILAFRAALATSDVAPQSAIVWDIGGGSMQMTTLTDSGIYLIDKGQTASIPFKNAIIQSIQQKDLASTPSPNPLSLVDIQNASQYAENLAIQTDPYIKDKIQKQTTHVLAVGSLFNYAIKPLVGTSEDISPQQLEEKILSLAGKSDSDLPGGSLAEVTVSNPLLVWSYMKALHISKIDIMSVNNADGALTYPAYWQ